MTKQTRRRFSPEYKEQSVARLSEPGATHSSVAVARTVDAGWRDRGLIRDARGHLKDRGYLAMGDQIIDASIVAVPKQRNSREESAG